MRTAQRTTKPAARRPAAIAEAEVKSIPCRWIRPSPDNERRHFTGPAFDALCESVKTRGVNDPILIRPIQTSGTSAICYEIVYGERRYQASLKAGRKEIPARIVELDAEEAADLRLIENLHREDLSPLELAEGLRRRLDTSGLTPSALAARLTMPESTLIDTLSLCKAPPVLRRALEAGVIPASTAAAVCRIPEEKTRQLLTLNVLTGAPYWNTTLTEKDLPKNLEEATPLGRAETRQLIAEFCTVALNRRARFPLTLAGLAGQVACNACPKLAKNMRGFVAGQGKAGMTCTDPGCFAEKESAWNKKTVADAAARGATVIPPAEAAKLFFQNGPLKAGTAWIDIDTECLGIHPPRPYRNLLPASVTNTAAIAIDPTGAPHWLVNRDLAASALKTDHGITIAGASAAGMATPADRRAEAARLLTQRVERETDRELIRRAGKAAAPLFCRLVPQLAKFSDEGENGRQVLRILALRVAGRLAGDAFDDFAAALELEGNSKTERMKALRTATNSAGPATLLVVAVQALTTDLAWNGRGVDDEQEHGKYLYNLFHLDRRRVAKEIRDRLEAGK